MVRRIASVLALGAGAWAASANADAAVGARVLRAYTIVVPPELRVPYSGRFRASFPHGFEPSVGSGLRLLGRDGDALRFLVVTDRGPNVEGPVIGRGRGARVTKVFPAPSFAPFFGELRVDSAEARLVSATPLRNPRRETLTGLPPPSGSRGARSDVPLSESLGRLALASEGLDPECIDRDAAGNLWLGDEYGPAIVRVEPRTGIVRRRYGPGAGLPEILSRRQLNRGFEGLAVAPNGKVYAILESVLDAAGNTGGGAHFIRLIELDPASGRVRMFAYPHDAELYASSRDAKVGDLAAIDSTRFLLIEQGRTQQGRPRNVVYAIDLDGATDLTNARTKDGRPVEFATAAELEALRLRPIRKQPILDLRALGWSVDKAEGLAIVDDHTIAVSSDADFGLRGMVNDDRKAADAGSRRAAQSSDAFTLMPHESGSGCNLWLIRLERPLSAVARFGAATPSGPSR